MNRYATILLAALFAGPVRADEATETRDQAVLRLGGTFLEGGGYRVSEVVLSGPGGNLSLLNAAQPTRGILDPGDIITAIDGRRFADHRELLDLLNDAYQRNGGSVQLTVVDVNTGKPVVWVARPEMTRMAVPVRAVPDDLTLPARPQLLAVPAALPRLSSPPEK